MTKVQDMQGRELDALVAKTFFGQTGFVHLTAQYMEGATEDGKDGWEGYYCPRCHQNASPGELCVAPYSTSPEYMWRVITALQKKGIYTTIYTFTGSVAAWDGSGVLAQASASSTDGIPRAVCQAALGAVGVCNG
jgi:hypothetical protein